MAQLVVRIADRTHADSAISATLYKRGDVVDVFPDGQLGVPQPTAHWAVLTISNVDVSRARRMVEQDIVLSGDNPVLERIRRNHVKWDLLPAEWVTALTTGDRALTLTLQQIRNYLYDKRTGDRVTL